MGNQIYEKAVKIIDVLEKNGYEAYMIGGFSRDLLLGKTADDIDLTTNALPQEIEACFSDQTLLEIGINHGTVTVIYNGTPFEITTYRIDSGSKDHRHPDSVSFSRSLRDDASRRDFTINAIAYHPVRGFLDFFGGQDDLRNKTIRCIGNPEERFEEDALRILRALRFASVLNFEIDPETRDAMFSKKELLLSISKERILEELKKTLCGNGVETILQQYREIFALLIPELAPAFDFDQRSPYHYLDLYSHCVHATANIPAEAPLRFAALLHDIGKPYCCTVDENGTGHYYGHSAVSADLAEKILTRLKTDSFLKTRAVLLIRSHDDPMDAREITVKRWLSKIGPDTFFDLLDLLRADALAQAPAYLGRLKEYDDAETLAKEILVKNECYSVKALAVNGNDLIALGYRGKEIGSALDRLLDAVIENRIPNERNPLLQYLNKTSG